MAEARPLLEIDNLSVSFPGVARPVLAVRGLRLRVREREIHALVGESGSGKSVTAKSILGLLPRPAAQIAAGRILFRGSDLCTMPVSELRQIRGGRIGMIFQEPGKHLNPSMKIRRQITETLTAHRGIDGSAAEKRARRLMDMVELSQGERVLDSYPHELSGGMKQRALIAIAISCDPALLVADEPTTALDAHIQGQILDLLLKLRDELSMAILFISHDFAVVQAIADTVSVIYTGAILETADAAELFMHPLQPYTDLLIQAVPDPDKHGRRLRSIPGAIPDAEHVPGGCPFHPRCPIAEDVCENTVPELIERRSGHLAACHFAGKLLRYSGGPQAPRQGGEVDSA